MRLLYTKILILSAMVLTSIVASAQVSVTATAANMGPASYTTLKGAFDAINAGTHKGAITISISGNTTETAKDSLGASGGASSYTSVLIKPAAGTNPVISGAIASNPLIDLWATTNVVFDGSNTVGGTTKNLTVVNSDTTGNTMRLINGSSNNVVKNMIIKGSTRSGIVGLAGVFQLSVSGATGNNNNVIQNNDITNDTKTPTYAFYHVGSSGLPNTGNVIIGNRIMNFNSIGYRDGNGSTGYSMNTYIIGNEIFLSVPSTLLAVYGIRLNNPSGIQNAYLYGNYIHDLTINNTATGTVVGIDFYDLLSFRCVNNIVRLSDPLANIRGIAQESDAASPAILNNTVVISGAVSGSGVSFNYLKNYTSVGDSVLNNIFVNTRTSTGAGNQYAIVNSSGTATLVPFLSNNNNIYSSGNALNFLGETAVTIGGVATGSNYTTLAQWQAGNSSDANSISVLPVFVSATDVHIDQSAAGNMAIDNKGIAAGNVVVDFDGQTRSASTPDIGADEFTVVTAAVSSVSSQVSASALLPNRVQNEARLHVVSRTAMTIQWTVTDASGRAVQRFAQTVQPGENSLNVHFGALGAGTYQVVGYDSKGGKTGLRFVKL